MKERKESEEVELLKQSLQQKELELSRTRMELDVYRTMVNIAKEVHGLDLSKKAGTKQ